MPEKTIRPQTADVHEKGFRQSTAWLHTWSGLIVGWVLFFVFATGTASYFSQEITRWMQPEHPIATAQPIAPGTPASERLAETERLVHLALDRLETVAPGAAEWQIILPHHKRIAGGWQDFSIVWEELIHTDEDDEHHHPKRLDPLTGDILPSAVPRDTAGGEGLMTLHYALHYVPHQTGVYIVGICTMIMFLAIISGIITHKKIFTDFFTFRPEKGQRSWLDAHNVISVMALPFFLVITYTGLVFSMFTYMPMTVTALYGSGGNGLRAFSTAFVDGERVEHAPVTRPAVSLAPLLAQAEAAWGSGRIESITIHRNVGGASEITLSRLKGGRIEHWDRPELHFDGATGTLLVPPSPQGNARSTAAATQGLLANLHTGEFAGIWLRWLFFASGLLGCAMVGTGLVLWTIKRRRHHLAAGREASETFGVQLVEILNAATIAGLPIALAAYFWANRLLPVDMADRAAWELHSLFAVWLGTAFFTMARPLNRAWIELLWGACAALALIPVINALSTDKHLVNTLGAGDLALAGFDLTMLALAAVFAVIALRVSRRLRAVAPLPMVATAVQAKAHP